MRSRSFRTVGTGLVLAATVALGLGTASSASASNTVSEWFPSANACQYRGNVLAQRGIVSGFNCSPGNGGWILTGWHW